MRYNICSNTGNSLQVSTETRVPGTVFSHNNNLDLLFDFKDETGVLEKLKRRYASEDFTNKADLKIVFTDLIRSLCEYDQNNTHRPLTKIDGYQHLTNMLLMAQFQSRNFYAKSK